jgi:putative phage-type endonuclease
MEAHLIQGSKEWLKFRKKFIGSSDCPVVMGIDPWKSPFQLFQEKFGLLNVEENFAMRRGKELEPLAREEFLKATGIRVEPDVRFHPELNWMMASLDGISSDSKEAVEIKCPGSESLTFKLAVEGKIPDHYNAQIQHQMAVLGLNNMFYFVFDGSTGIVLEIKRDDAYIDSIYRKETEFWNRLRNFEPPELLDKDYREIASDEWNQWVNVYNEADAMLKDAEEKKERARKMLIDLSNGQNTRGKGLTLTKYVRRGTIDYNLVPELLGKDLEPYRKKPAESWRITSK